MVRVLGRTEVTGSDGACLDVGSRKPRSVLAALALRHGTDTSADLLVDLLWGEEAPRTATGTLQAYISGLRRVMESGSGSRVLVTTDHGYRLDLPADVVDAHAFVSEVREVHRRVAPLASQLSTGRVGSWPGRGQVVADADRLEHLLAQWRGAAYADLLDHPDVLAARSSLDELRSGAEDDRLLALLALGEHAAVLAATEEATARDPLRERAWALHALALTRSGRTADALRALRRIRRLLADELGVDPGRELQNLERLVLNQDPVLQQRLPDPPTTPGRAVPAPAPTPNAWQAVGRETEEARLLRLLEDADAGYPECAMVVGEPGIGKSRLAGRVATAAAERGFAVAFGRCSQDEGAPPLWPWRAVLEALDAARDHSLAGLFQGGEEADEFHSQDAIASVVRERAADGPVLIVLDDLHWADTSTLRVLTHLLTTMTGSERLLVLGTRRPWPQPSGPLAEAGEAFARRHGTRIDLTGLTLDEATALVSSLTGDADDEVVAAWHERAGGNPFYLVELARLGTARRIPPTVRDVVLRRVDTLPADTRDLLLLASALGRELWLDLLAAVVGLDPDEADERLDAARASGLLVDRAPGRVAFSHALTRDAVDSMLTSTRRSRIHARIAHTLENETNLAVMRPEERVADLARHWLAAGPAHTGRAWRAALAAADQARRVFSHEEAAKLMRQAIEALRRDPAATDDDLYEALLLSAHDHQRAAHWRGVVAAAFDAISLARRNDDPVRMAAAAAEISRYSVWTPHDWGVVNDEVIDDLRWALNRLSPDDSTARVQLMLALAVELYYVPTSDAEVRALVDEGIAAARRIGDPRLLTWAARAAWTALWAPRFAEDRRELSALMLAAARETGDEELEALALTTTGADALEAGDMEGYLNDLRSAERIARRRRLFYVELALAWEELTLSTMRGDAAEAQRRAEQLRRLRNRVATPADELHEVGLQIARLFWEPESLAPLVDPLRGALEEAEGDAGRDVLYLLMARLGLVDQLRQAIEAHPLAYPKQNWATATAGCSLAECAVALADPTLALQAVDVLGPLSGRHAIAGISIATGPVDGYLALAEAVLGRTEAATAHADHAVAQADAWGLPVYREWLLGQRAALGF